MATKAIGTLDYSVSMLANSMNENDPRRAYASLQLEGSVSTEQLCEHITEHNSVFSKGVVIGVITEMAGCLRELLLQGYSVELADVGIIYPSIKSKGAASLEKFTVDNIISLTAKFRPRGKMANLLQDAQFQRVSTRKAQAATLAAQTQGQESADWSGLPAVTPVTPEP